MKAVCPNNSEHKRFITTAHVMQEWEVDNHGNFVKELVPCLEISSEPDSGNEWVCADCQDDPETADQIVLAEFRYDG